MITINKKTIPTEKLHAQRRLLLYRESKKTVNVICVNGSF